MQEDALRTVNAQTQVRRWKTTSGCFKTLVSGGYIFSLIFFEYPVIEMDSYYRERCQDVCETLSDRVGKCGETCERALSVYSRERGKIFNAAIPAPKMVSLYDEPARFEEAGVENHPVKSMAQSSGSRLARASPSVGGRTKSPGRPFESMARGSGESADEKRRLAPATGVDARFSSLEGFGLARADAFSSEAFNSHPKKRARLPLT